MWRSIPAVFQDLPAAVLGRLRFTSSLCSYLLLSSSSARYFPASFGDNCSSFRHDCGLQKHSVVHTLFCDQLLNLSLEVIGCIFIGRTQESLRSSVAESCWRGSAPRRLAWRFGCVPGFRITFAQSNSSKRYVVKSTLPLRAYNVFHEPVLHIQPLSCGVPAYSLRKVI